MGTSTDPGLTSTNSAPNADICGLGQLLHAPSYQPTTPSKALAPVNDSLPLTPGTPGHNSEPEAKSIAQPTLNQSPATPPATPQSSRLVENTAEPPRKRRCLERTAQGLSESENESIFDLGCDNLFLTDPEASDSLFCLGAPEYSCDDDIFEFPKYIQSVVADETCRIEENGANDILALADVQVPNCGAVSNGLETSSTEVCFGMVGHHLLSLRCPAHISA
jgi:hypothetical protein